MAARKSAGKKKSKPVTRAKKTTKRVATGAKKTAKRATSAAKSLAGKASKATHTATKVGSVLEGVGKFIEGGAAAIEAALNTVNKKPAARKKTAKPSA
jgi:hypothetical protein